MNVPIDTEFQSLVHPLTHEEKAGLEKLLLQDGCLDPLRVWKEGNLLLDGHNRFDLCTLHNISYNVEYLSFADRHAAINWIIDNQLGRRNSTEQQKSYLRGKRYREEKKIVTNPEGSNQYKEVGGQNVHQPKTAEALAKEYHVEEKTIRRDAKFSEGVDLIAVAAPDEKTAILSHTSALKKQDVQRIASIPKQVEREVRARTILTTEDEIQKRVDAEAKRLAKEQLDALLKKRKQQKEEKKQHAQKAREELLKRVEKEREERPAHIKVLPSLLLVDPPWQYRHCATNNRKIENHYETAHHDELVTHLPETQDNCVLFMWVTAPKVAEGIDLVRAWGFDYRTCAVWDKEKIGMGYWFRGEHEILFIAVKGKVSPPQPSERVSSMFRETRTEHSQKPECVYEWIEKAFAEHDKLEMYCRKPREGWQVWGNEV